MSLKPTTPLLPGISQFDVDFVIPRVGIDLPLGIDPFLLYKSRDPIFQQLHSSMISAFNWGIKLIDDGDKDQALEFFGYPEVAEIGLGYTQKGKRGSGVGEYMSSLLVETLVDAPLLRSRGVRHIEEMQLVSLGIGPDRVSDIAANLLKEYLIHYTQKQCNTWGIAFRKSVPLAHIYSYEKQEWYDGYFDLPTSPLNNAPMLFVPRRIVRTLPWINYGDYYRMEFSTYLRAKRVRTNLKRNRGEVPTGLKKLQKEEVVQLTRAEVERIDNYVTAKENDAFNAQPSFNYIEEEGWCPEAEMLKDKLAKVAPGTKDATFYQRVVLEILNYLFNPELINGELEVRTIDGTERRDIIFTNDSDKTFWTYLRGEHSSVFIMFETKNTSELDNTHINQTATYLGDRLGRFGLIVTRSAIADAQRRKTYSVYNDSQPRKVILVLNDQDLKQMLAMRCTGKDPMRYIQKLYRDFRTGVQ